MTLAGIIRALGPVDLKNVRRENFLAWIVGGPLLVALLFRFSVPPLTSYLTGTYGFDLTPYYPLIMSSFVLLAPSMIGMVVGFLIIDERDDRVLAALMVTPISPAGYLAYRTLIPMLVGTLITVVCYPLAGLTPLSLANLIAVCLLASVSAPITAIFLAVFAENKISGFALVKILNTASFVPVGAYFLEMPIQLAAGIVPTYWPAKMLWEAVEGEPVAMYGLAGACVSATVMYLLLRRFERVLTS